MTSVLFLSCFQCHPRLRTRKVALPPLELEALREGFSAAGRESGRKLVKKVGGT